MKTEEIVRELRYPVGRCRNLEELMATSAERLEFLERALEEFRFWANPKRYIDNANDPYWRLIASAKDEDKMPHLAAWLQEHNASTVPVGDGA